MAIDHHRANPLDQLVRKATLAQFAFQRLGILWIQRVVQVGKQCPQGQSHGRIQFAGFNSQGGSCFGSHSFFKTVVRQPANAVPTK